MIVERPVPDVPLEYDVGDAPDAQSGSASSGTYPWAWDDNDATHLALLEELEDALARKRPVGFAAWPEGV